MSKGFTLIELIVVLAIMATFSVVLILNFRSSPRTQAARQQTASVIISDFRRAQSMALAGNRFQGNIVCGFGVHYISSSSYLIYVGVLDGGAIICQNANHNYQAGIDLIAENRVLANENMEIRSSFNDVFFEPPDPKTYINNSALLSAPPATVTVQLKGQASCNGGTCTDVKIYTSGQIDLN